MLKQPPFANIMLDRMKTRGTYAKGFPLGAIVHFTAGRDGAVAAINEGIKNGYAYWCIERSGKLFCAHDVDKWGYHAGESRWDKVAKPLVGTVSDDLIGIEMNAAGRLIYHPNADKTQEYFSTWFNTKLTGEDTRYTSGKDNQQQGWYEKYTVAQEQTLIETLFWLKDQAPDVFDFDYVLGHDEVAPLRKNDPGAALSMTMPEFREFLKVQYAKRSQGVK